MSGYAPTWKTYTMAKRRRNKRREEEQQRKPKKIAKQLAKRGVSAKKIVKKTGVSRSKAKSLDKKFDAPKPKATKKKSAPKNNLKKLKTISREDFKSLSKDKRQETRNVARAYARRGASAKKIVKKVGTTRKMARKLDKKFDKGDYKKTKKIKDKQPGVGHFKMIKKKDPDRKKDKRAIKKFRDSNLKDLLERKATAFTPKAPVEQTAPVVDKGPSRLDRMREETKALEQAANTAESGLESSNSTTTKSSGVTSEADLFSGIEGGAGTLAGTSATGIRARRSRAFRSGLTSRGTQQLNRLLIGTAGVFGL